MTEVLTEGPSVQINGETVRLTLKNEGVTGLPARYAWIIDRDEFHLRDPDVYTLNNAGQMGPVRMAAELHDRLLVLDSRGFHGRAFRIYDGSGVHLYSGRIVTSDAAIGTARDYAPLYEFAEEHGGVTISYWDDRERCWSQLHE